MSLPTLLPAASSLSEPAAQSVLTPAALWIESLVLGSIATALGVLAIATCGLLMLSGRIDARRGITVVIGCFILFGAPVIAAGLRSVGQGQTLTTPSTGTAPIATGPVTSVYDPYAGASLAR